jgi:hypothetical protein
MAEDEAKACCWRCQRTDTERVKVKIQTAEMTKEAVAEECKHTLACISWSIEATQKHLQAEYGPNR